MRLPGVAPGPSTWQEDILLLNHSREIKRAGSFTLPAHAISTKNKHLLVIYSIPTRGFTAAVSVFRGTPPPKPLNCKVWEKPAWRLRRPCLSLRGAMFPESKIFRSAFRSLFLSNKKPCLLFGKQGLEKFYGSSLTCLPPGYPNSFRGFVLYTIWIGQG